MAHPTAAAALYPHLESGDQAPKQQQPAQSLAEALYPRPKAKPPNPYSDREILLKNLRALNARIDARLARERGR